MARAAIDIGSNSILLTVLDAKGAVLHDEARVVGLGTGLGDRGLFKPDRIAAAEAVIDDYLAAARRHGVEPWQIKAVATSAARRAMNAETWFSRLMSKTGLRVRIIAGDDEARLTWLGALRDLDIAPGPVLVVDLGGGSTELVLGDGDDLLGRTSIELGSARLTEAFLGRSEGGMPDPGGLARMRNHVDVVLGSVSLDPRPRTIVAVAGTATTLAATHLGLTAYDSAKVHGSQLTRTDLAGFVDRLLTASADERRTLFAVSPARADYMLAGVTVLDRVLVSARRQSMRISDRGLRFGVLA
ncbi:MAG: exopolyphosphatase/guanosine-5'-triphosphate,3'-diphosphate pyrophosphatase [Myxococcota bacterium]|jgi:exopolyphosphatase/guanosine-5'-triphosphate,3'-diphosphate pyrophosphatase